MGNTMMCSFSTMSKKRVIIYGIIGIWKTIVKVLRQLIIGCMVHLSVLMKTEDLTGIVLCKLFLIPRGLLGFLMDMTAKVQYLTTV